MSSAITLITPRNQATRFRGWNDEEHDFCTGQNFALHRLHVCIMRPVDGGSEPIDRHTPVQQQSYSSVPKEIPVALVGLTGFVYREAGRRGARQQQQQIIDRVAGVRTVCVYTNNTTCH